MKFEKTEQEGKSKKIEERFEAIILERGLTRLRPIADYVLVLRRAFPVYDLDLK